MTLREAEMIQFRSGLIQGGSVEMGSVNSVQPFPTRLPHPRQTWLVDQDVLSSRAPMGPLKSSLSSLAASINH